LREEDVDSVLVYGGEKSNWHNSRDFKSDKSIQEMFLRTVSLEGTRIRYVPPGTRRGRERDLINFKPEGDHVVSSKCLISSHNYDLYEWEGPRTRKRRVVATLKGVFNLRLICGGRY